MIIDRGHISITEGEVIIMTEMEAVRSRHSVRKYQDKRIEKEQIKCLEKKIEELNEEGNIHLQFIEDSASTFSKLFNKSVGLGSAPSVIACVGPDDDTLDERIGYYGQKLVIYAQQLGLNTCWVGTFNRKKIPVEISDGERLVIAIAIGYGQTQGKQRKTKTADEVVIDLKDVPDWFHAGVEAALLAPTAINQQKFEIIYNENEEVEFKDLGGVLSKIDIGIVKCNFEIGVEDYKSHYDNA